MRLLSTILLVIGCACGALAQTSEIALPAGTGQSPEVILTKPITLDQALTIAFQCNPQIKTAIAQIERSEAGMREASARFFPSFTAQVNRTYQPEVSLAFAQPGQQAQDVVVQNATTTNAQLGVTLPLDISKRLGFASDIARYQFQIDYLGLLAQSEQLIFRVKTAYYDTLRAQGQEEVAQASVDVAAARLQDTNARFAAGTVPRFDVTRAQVEVANLNQTLISAKSRVGVSRAALNRVLGIDPSLPTELVRSEITVENIKVDAQASVKEAYTRRPEVRQADLAIELARRNVRFRRADLFPSLAVSAQTTYNPDTSTFMPEKVSWLALVGLTIPVWDGGVTKARVDQANADVDIAIDNLTTTRLTVGFDVQSAALTLQEGIERVSTTAENVALAEEALRLASVRYNGGISTLVEVTDAESALTQARVDYVNARFDYVLGLAGLQRATGTQPELAGLQLLATESYKKVEPCLKP